MKRRDYSDVLGPIVVLACRCSVWPTAVLWPLRRCGECRVQPKPIPDYEERDL